MKKYQLWILKTAARVSNYLVSHTEAGQLHEWEQRREPGLLGTLGYNAMQGLGSSRGMYKVSDGQEQRVFQPKTRDSCVQEHRCCGQPK